MKYNFSQLTELAKPQSSQFKITSIKEAFHFCEKLANAHYENFPVGSILIPKESRKYFYSIYSFARLADDIADENQSVSENIKYSILVDLESNLELENSFVTTPILKAVLITCEETNIAIDDLKRLLIAFKMDVKFIQPKNIDDLFEYCHYSANPIGEMLLKLFGEDTKETISYSNDICTALQLVNFWQDISRDKLADRFYIPISYLEKYSVSYSTLVENKENFNIILDELYQETEKLFENGKKILYLVKNKHLKLELRLIISSGLRILEKCRNLKEEIVFKRPRLTKVDSIKIAYKAFTI